MDWYNRRPKHNGGDASVPAEESDVGWPHYNSNRQRATSSLESASGMSQRHQPLDGLAESSKRGNDDASLLLLLNAKRRKLQAEIDGLEQQARAVQERLVTRDAARRRTAWLTAEEEPRNRRSAYELDSLSLTSPSSRAYLDHRRLVYDDVARNHESATALLEHHRGGVRQFLSATTESYERSTGAGMSHHHDGGSPSSNARRSMTGSWGVSSDDGRRMSETMALSLRESESSVKQRSRTTSRLLSRSSSRPKEQSARSLVTSRAAAIQPSPAATAPLAPSDMPLSLPADSKYLSRYQVLVRQGLEFFVASDEDINTSQKGRKRKVRLHQIGIRCRYCAHLHPSLRTRGSSTYPRQKSSFYLCAQNIIMAHLVPPPAKESVEGDAADKASSPHEPCHCLPPAMVTLLAEEKAKQSASAVGSGYWANEGCAHDFVEREGAVWLRNAPPPRMTRDGDGATASSSPSRGATAPLEGGSY